MSKKFLIYIFILFAGFLTCQHALAFTVDKIINNQAPEIFVYPYEFDKLVLDITIPSGNSNSVDVLNAIVIQNEGTARNLREIARFILWQDANKVGFEGMGLDTKIGELSYNADNASWHLNNLAVNIPTGGSRFFVSAETMSSTTVNTYFQMRVTQLSDQNANGVFNAGDFGIFLASKNNGPTDQNILNINKQTMRAFVVDTASPKAVIIDPLDNAVIATSTYKIKGMAKDMQGSAVQHVLLDIDGSLKEVILTSDNYGTFEYNWQSISEGKHTLRLQATDFLGNTVVSEPISVEIKIPVASVVVPITPVIVATTSVVIATTTPMSPPFVFKVNLRYGNRSADVKKLQEILISEKLLGIGLNTGYFGVLTKAAVIKFQEKYKSEVLASFGLSKGTGFVGEKTREKLNKIL